MAQSGGGGPFHRRGPDKRLVRFVLGYGNQPSHWLPMDAQNVECKLMEVKKYSAPYFELDSKFRRKDLELITAFAVQNPFLYGSFKLRREQLQMQMANTDDHVRERTMYYATTFDNFEMIVRSNFSSAYFDGHKQRMKFFSTSERANSVLGESENPRIMFSVRVVMGVTLELEEETALDAKARRPPPLSKEHGLPVDTLVAEEGKVVYKYNANDVYPDFVLVYRDKSLEDPSDKRSSRIAEMLRFCAISYRAGTRFNPDEATYKGTKKSSTSGSVEGVDSADDGTEKKRKKDKKVSKLKNVPSQSNAAKLKASAAAETGAIPKTSAATINRRQTSEDRNSSEDIEMQSLVVTSAVVEANPCKTLDQEDEQKAKVDGEKEKPEE